MDEAEKIMGIDIVMVHQATERGAVVAEILLLDAPGLPGIDIEQPGNKSTDTLIDLIEQVETRRIDSFVEIEDPGLDMVEVCKAHVSRVPGVTCFVNSLLRPLGHDRCPMSKTDSLKTRSGLGI